MRRAARIDDNQAAIVAALRKDGCKVKSTAAVGDGWPDITVQGPDGKIHLMEIKNPDQPPSKRKLREKQQKLHDEGWNISVVTNWAEALNVVAWRQQ